MAGKILATIAPQWKLSHVAAYAVVCFLAFVPYMWAFYPGIVEVDTSFQIAMSLGYGYGTIEDYASPFPVFDIRLLGALYALGEAIWHDATGGIWAICLFQCVGIAASISLMACYLSQWKVPAWARFLVLAFLAVNPIVPLMAVDVGKDTVFCVFFVPFCICVCEYIRRAAFEQPGTEHNRRNRLGLAACAFMFGTLSFLTVSKGIVIVLGCVAIAFVFAHKKKNKQLSKSLGAVFGSCVAAQLVFSLAISPVMSVGLPDSSSFLRESLGTPIQQATWTVKVNGNVTDAERAKLDAFYDLGAAVECYNRDTSDDAKVFVRKDASLSDAIWMLDAYVSIGISHPKEYAKSFVDLYDGFWQAGTPESLMLPRFMPNNDSDSPLDWKGNMFRMPVSSIGEAIEAVQNDWVMYSHGNLPEYEKQHPDFGDWKMNEDSAQPRRDIISSIMQIGKIPVLGLLVSKSAYVLYLPLLLLAIAAIGTRHGRKGAAVLLLAPLGLSCMLAFLSPADLARYVYPCLMLCPMYFALTIHVVRTSRKEDATTYDDSSIGVTVED